MSKSERFRLAVQRGEPFPDVDDKIRQQFSVTQQDIFKALPDCKFSIAPFDIKTLTIEFTSTSDGLVVVSAVYYAHGKLEKYK
jgi:hypothetical protein